MIAIRLVREYSNQSTEAATSVLENYLQEKLETMYLQQTQLAQESVVNQLSENPTLLQGGMSVAVILALAVLFKSMADLAKAFRGN